MNEELSKQVGREKITNEICKFAEQSERKVRRGNNLDEMMSEDSEEDDVKIKYREKLREVKSQFGQGNQKFKYTQYLEILRGKPQRKSRKQKLNIPL